jgi:general stress protein CsbA
MCFSATASFSAGIALSVIGAASIKKAQDSSQYAFAFIPLLFAIQQFSEGFLWLSFINPDFEQMRQPATYFFLFFAQVVWPLIAPIALLLIVKKEVRINSQRIFVVIGSLLSVYLFYCLWNYPVSAEASEQHIAYKMNYPPSLRNYAGILYTAATILPPFFTRIKSMWLLGAAILISYIISAILYTDYLVSVWCFFASVISLSILYILVNIVNSDKKSKVSGLETTSTLI